MIELNIPSEYYNDDFNTIISLCPHWIHYTNTIEMLGDNHYSYEYQWFPGPDIGYIMARRELDTEMVQVIHIGTGFDNCEEYFFESLDAAKFVCDILISYHIKDIFNQTDSTYEFLTEFYKKEKIN